MEDGGDLLTELVPLHRWGVGELHRAHFSNATEELTDTAELHYRAWQRLADEGLEFRKA